MKKAQFLFQVDQPWCDTSETLSFIEETKTLRLEYGHQDSVTSKSSTQSGAGFNESGTLPYSDEDGEPGVNGDAFQLGTLLSPAVQHVRTEAATNDRHIFEDHGFNNWERDRLLSPSERFSMNPRLVGFSHSAIFPVTDQQTAVALRAFQSKLAPTIDLGSEPGLSDTLLSIGSNHHRLIYAIMRAYTSSTFPSQCRPNELEDSAEGPSRSFSSSHYSEELIAKLFLKFMTEVVRK